MAAKKKSLALILGLSPKGEESEEKMDDGDSKAIRKKALESFKTMCEAIKNDDYEAGLKAFCAIHGFDHALWDLDEDMSDGGDSESDAEEDLDEAESEEDED